MWMRTVLLGVVSLSVGVMSAAANAQEQTLDLFRTIDVAPDGTQPEPDTKQLFLSRLDVRGVAERPDTSSFESPYRAGS